MVAVVDGAASIAPLPHRHVEWWRGGRCGAGGSTAIPAKWRGMEDDVEFDLAEAWCLFRRGAENRPSPVLR